MWGFIIFAIIVAIVGGILQAQHQAKKQAERANKMSTRFNSINDFKVSRKINGFGGFYTFAIDDESEKIAFVSEYTRKIIDYKDIIGVEIIEDGNTIMSKSASRTIGGALIGGVLAGGAGSIVGGLSGNTKQKNKVSSLSVKILIRDTQYPSLEIKCFESSTMTTERKKSLETEGKLESHIYQSCKRQANEIKDMLSVIIDKMDNKSKKNNFNPSSNSIADELLKLNDLKEKGILTEVEFAEQKKRILNT